MKINLLLIQLSLAIIIIFGGTFTLRYYIKGELLLDQLIAASIGLVLLIGSLIWKVINKRKQYES